MDKLRIGLVGHGNAAGLHMPGFQRLGPDRCQVVAVCGRSQERAASWAAKHGITRAFGSLEEMLAKTEIDAVDLAVPNHVHADYITKAARAGKHIICEKPLGGCKTVPKQLMLDRVKEQCDAVLDMVRGAGVRFGYAENWVYAPAIVKLRRLAEAAGGTIMRIEAEESHSGSPSPYSRRWRTAGGGSLNLKGSHPLGAVLQLKQWEGQSKFGRPIRPAFVFCEVGNLTAIEAFTRETTHYLKTGWQDVEDWGVIAIKFEDGSVAEVKAADTTLGGVHNYLEAYLSNARIRANINPNTSCVAYAPRADIFGDEYIWEKIETKAGWTFPSPDDSWNQGYAQELADFVSAITEEREPMSGLMLACDVMVVLYAAYVSAEEGRRVDVRPYLG